METKTVREWFEGVECDTLRGVLLERMNRRWGKEVADSIFDAIISAFIWENSPEGKRFWNRIYNNESFDSFYTKYPKKRDFFKEVGELLDSRLVDSISIYPDRSGEVASKNINEYSYDNEKEFFELKDKIMNETKVKVSLDNLKGKFIELSKEEEKGAEQYLRLAEELYDTRKAVLIREKYLVLVTDKGYLSRNELDMPFLLHNSEVVKFECLDFN